jgi:hypothetical protein
MTQMAKFVDRLLVAGATWKELKEKAAREAKQQNTKTLSTLGQLHAHVRYRAKHNSWEFEETETWVRGYPPFAAWERRLNLPRKAVPAVLGISRQSAHDLRTGRTKPHPSTRRLMQVIEDPGLIEQLARRDER